MSEKTTDHSLDFLDDLQARITACWQSGELDTEAIETALELLDTGAIRVATFDESASENRPENSGWTIHEWVKQAVLLYFRSHANETIEHGPFEYRDKVPIKRGFEKLGVRVVPPATARYGSFLSPDVVLMPSYINIGAWIGSGTMVDMGAVVGSCAQIGARVHLSAGVMIGGVLEPIQAAPVIVEDGAFIGSGCIVVEGARVGREAVLGANVVITNSTPVIDVTGDTPVEHRGYVPARAIVIPGTRTKSFPAGDYALSAGLIIGWRSDATDQKVALNDILRENGAGV